MDRTKNRPVPSGRMSVNVAVGVAILLTIIGLTLLYMINQRQQCLVRFQYFIHECLYTLKNCNIVIRFVGAFQGNSFMLGWVAATGNFV
jgi:protoheme IX farnesyltransferase